MQGISDENNKSEAFGDMKTNISNDKPKEKDSASYEMEKLRKSQ
jgi:hypothetical protein